MDAVAEQELPPDRQNVNRQLVALYISTFLLRIGFAASLILFDWTLVFGIETHLGHEAASEFGPIFLTSFAAITFLIAEIMFTGYYGHRSDSTGVKPILLWATLGAAVVLVLYAPAPYFLLLSDHGWTAVIYMVLYLALIHFLHGVVASGKVSPTLGFINYNSEDHNRALRMAWYDNAILYGRAVGMPFGGMLWFWMGVDEHGITYEEQVSRLARTFPVLGIILVISALLILFGINNTPKHTEVKPFSLKEDVTLAARVMLEPKRKPLLAPWLALAALIGSVSLWGPSIAFRSSEAGEERSVDALIPIIVIIVALALPAPLWGKYADSHDRKSAMKLGISGMPLLGVGALIFVLAGSPGGFDLSNFWFLAAIVPGIMVISALVPVLMGALGDTAEKGIHDDGQVMSGYHFIIALGEIIGILIGGIAIALFALLETATGIFGGQSNALLGGFLLFELILLVVVIVGVLKIPQDHMDKNRK
ncbi:MAG: MFS transporter [Candidatus Heimdallarchaeota archaeon]|nr:MFS transporter [Candidatus Heimdallarchaeota archaeon]